MRRSRSADALALLGGVGGIACFAAALVVLYRVPQSFRQTDALLSISGWSAAATFGLAIGAIVLGPRRVLPNLAVAAAVLAVAIWWATAEIHRDTKDAQGGVSTRD